MDKDGRQLDRYGNLLVMQQSSDASNSLRTGHSSFVEDAALTGSDWVQKSLRHASLMLSAENSFKIANHGSPDRDLRPEPFNK